LSSCQHSWANSGRNSNQKSSGQAGSYQEGSGQEGSGQDKPASSVVYEFEHWQGVVDGIIGCSACGQTALIRLLDWRGEQLQQRIYSIGLIPTEVSDVFLRNMRSHYCDLQRKHDERQALYSAVPATQIGLFSLPDMQCEKNHSVASPIQYPKWQQLAPDHPDSPWWPFFLDNCNEPASDLSQLL
tara:strand:- start:17712 stop:18266 length:555 start_codon:yes stop_codon:yes gene_type:complete